MKIDLGNEGLKLIGRRASLRLYACNTVVHLMAVTASLSIVGCGICSDEVKVERASPDGYKDNDSAVFVASGRGPLRIVWDDARHLRIDCGGYQRKNIFKEVTVLGDVDIFY